MDTWCSRCDRLNPERECPGCGMGGSPYWRCSCGTDNEAAAEACCCGWVRPDIPLPAADDLRASNMPSLPSMIPRSLAVLELEDDVAHVAGPPSLPCGPGSLPRAASLPPSSDSNPPDE